MILDKGIQIKKNLKEYAEIVIPVSGNNFDNKNVVFIIKKKMRNMFFSRRAKKG